MHQRILDAHARMLKLLCASYARLRTLFGEYRLVSHANKGVADILWPMGGVWFSGQTLLVISHDVNVQCLLSVFSPSVPA